MYALVGRGVFPFLQRLGGDDSTYAHHVRDARFAIPTPALLARIVDMIDELPMADRDTNGDLYEYMLGNRHLQARRPVPDAATHQRADGRDDRAHAIGRGL